MSLFPGIKTQSGFVPGYQNLLRVCFRVQKPMLSFFQWLKTQLVFVSTIKILASIYIRDWKHLWYLSKFINCKYRTFWWLLSLGGDIFWMLEQIWFDWYKIVWGEENLSRILIIFLNSKCQIAQCTTISQLRRWYILDPDT